MINEMYNLILCSNIKIRCIFQLITFEIEVLTMKLNG